jgi:hypothetical protein
VILFFPVHAVIRKRIPRLAMVTFGFVLVIVGLYAFVVGLKLGLFPIGERMAEQLIGHDRIVFVYLFAFAIGFATTMAEPALIAIGKKAEEAAKGRINGSAIRLIVALGVAIGITIGVHRIITGDSIHMYIIGGYSPCHRADLAGAALHHRFGLRPGRGDHLGGHRTADHRAGHRPGHPYRGTQYHDRRLRPDRLCVHFSHRHRYALCNRDGARARSPNEVQPMKFSVLIAILAEEMEDKAVDIARDAGAGAVTLMSARGITGDEKKTFFGLTYEGAQSVLMFVLEKEALAAGAQVPDPRAGSGQ